MIQMTWPDDGALDDAWVKVGAVRFSGGTAAERAGGLDQTFGEVAPESVKVSPFI